MDYLLHDPLVQGIVLKMLADLCHALFVKVDDSGVAVNEKYLSYVSVILAVLASGVNLALQGHLASLDLSSLGTLLLAFAGVKAAPSIKPLVKLCVKPKQ